MRQIAIDLPDRPEYKHPSAWAVQEARRLVTEFVAGKGVRAFLFGSRADGSAKPFSDLDIALSAGESPVLGGLMARLSEAFEDSRIPFDVDLVDLYYATPGFKRAIEEEGTEWTA